MGGQVHQTHSQEGLQVREQVCQAPGEGCQVRLRQPAETEQGVSHSLTSFPPNPETPKCDQLLATNSQLKLATKFQLRDANIQLPATNCPAAQYRLTNKTRLEFLSVMVASGTGGGGATLPRPSTWRPPVSVRRGPR